MQNINSYLNQLDTQPRPYQRRIIESVANGFEGELKYLLIESATGSGKTVMGLMIAKYFQEKHGMTIGWSAMRRNLLSQTETENKEKGFNVKIEYISMFDKNPPSVDLLIVDEAHHDATKSMAVIHNKIKPKKVLGLTATPFRTDRIGLAFEKVVRDAGIRELIRDGYLSRFNHYTLNEYSPESVARAYLEDRKKWGKTVMFFHTNDQCREVAQRLREGGVSCEVVTASTDRDAQIASYESGECDVLINMMVLTEGFNSPSTKTAFVRPSGRGPTCQMAGRVLRLWSEYGNVKQIVQSRDSRYPFTRQASASEQFIVRDGGWISLGSSENMDAALKVATRARATLQHSDKTEFALRYCRNYAERKKKVRARRA